MLGKTRTRIERRLYQRGFNSPEVRKLLVDQILLTGCSVGVGLVLCWYSVWPLLFGIGAGLACCNLWGMAGFVQRHLRRDFTPAVALKQFGFFFARLAGTAAVLALLVIVLRAPVAPVLVGLSSVVAGITIRGIYSKAKEA